MPGGREAGTGTQHPPPPSQQMIITGESRIFINWGTEVLADWHRAGLELCSVPGGRWGCGGQELGKSHLWLQDLVPLCCSEFAWSMPPCQCVPQATCSIIAVPRDLYEGALGHPISVPGSHEHPQGLHAASRRGGILQTPFPKSLGSTSWCHLQSPCVPT